MFSRVSFAVAACLVSAVASSPGFLATSLSNSSASAEKAAFLDLLEEAVGSGRRHSTESRLGVIRDILQTTFEAMPKTSQGRLSATSARYAMHRLFVQRHGWHVKGVAPTGGTWSPTSAALGFSEHLPLGLQPLVSNKFGQDDFDLDELALLGATIEALIHSEAVGRLHGAYKALGLNPQEPLGINESVEAIYTCFTAYITGCNVSAATREELQDLTSSVEKEFPKWNETKILIHEMREHWAPNREMLEFQDVELILEMVGEKMGHRVDEGACQDIEDKLLEMQEGNGTGRVKLSDFYSVSRDTDNFEFNERPEFLRQQGVLDESDPSVPRVMIPNYLTMQSNCLNVSSYYDLCCIDLCEDLMDTLERQIRNSQASPETILSILSDTESSYVPIGREFTGPLKNKLNEVAAHHNGQVPLHGRLFSQWMHFAYPFECPYPHLSGTTKPTTNSEWLAQSGISASASQEELKIWVGEIQKAPKTSGCDDSEDGMCMWAPEEELVDAASWRVSLEGPAVTPAESADTTRFGVRTVLRSVAALAMVASSVMGLRNVAKQLKIGFEDMNVGGKKSSSAMFFAKVFGRPVKDSELTV